LSLGICFITHNRVEYSKRSFTSLLETTGPSDVIIIVDNASTDGTLEWISEMWDGEVGRNYPQFKGTVALTKNMYPGFSANKGWDQCLKVNSDIDLLVRVDNDMLMLPGWRSEVVKAFDAMPLLGQLGLMNQEQCFVDSEEWKGKTPAMPVVEHTERDYTVNTWWTSIGGPNTIRRDLWDMGLRYDESAWAAHDPNIPTPQEDVKLSLQVKSMGYFFANMLPHLCVEMSFGNTDDYYDYYLKTFTDRGHTPPARTRGGVTLEAASGDVGGHGSATDHI